MWIDDDLPAEAAATIQPMCAAAEELLRADQHTQAIATFKEAFGLLPEPREQWFAGTWLLTAIGDAAYLSGDLATAADSFQQISYFPGWQDNAFMRLRRGQVAYDMGQLETAANELASAFMLGGYRILEFDDEKYARFVLSKLLPPVPPVDHPLARFHLRENRPWWKVW